MPTFKRGNDVADFPEGLRGFVTSHGWTAVDATPADAAPVAVVPEPAPAAPETPAVPTTAPADDNTSGVIND